MLVFFERRFKSKLKNASIDNIIRLAKKNESIYDTIFWSI